MKSYKSFFVGHGIKLLTTVLIGFIGIFASGVRAADTNASPGHLSKADFEFATTAATGGAMEVALGQIASQKAASPGVKQFGEQMVTDHGQAGEKLKQIALAQGATLPDQPTAKQQKEIDRLNGLSGEAFDKEYVSLMVKDHEKDLKEFQSASRKTENADLRSFAVETTSVIEHHLHMVKSLADQVASVSK